MKFAFIVAAVFFVLAFTDISLKEWRSVPIGNSNVAEATKLPDLLTMGPDPGGHTGATVTSETTKTGQSAVDGARGAASGGKTETSGPPVSAGQQSKK